MIELYTRPEMARNILELKIVYRQGWKLELATAEALFAKPTTVPPEAARVPAPKTRQLRT